METNKEYQKEYKQYMRAVKKDGDLLKVKI
jgi:hypothetical protein